MDFCNNRKLICNFLLVNNTKLHFISHRFLQLSRTIGKIITFDNGVFFFNTFILSNLCEFITRHTLSKLDTLD